MWKRMALTGIGLMATVSLTACPALFPPGSAGDGTVTCAGGVAHTAASPGFTTSPQQVTLTLTAPTSVATCTDGTGTGITSAQIVALSVTFPSIGCAGGAGSTASGTADLRWSDGSHSAADVAVTMGVMLTGTLSLDITSGHFAGLSGSTDFLGSPSGGDCTTGITGETVTIDSFTLA